MSDPQPKIDERSLLVHLNEIGIALSSEQDLRTLLGKIVAEARRFTNAEAGSLYLIEGDEMRFEVAQNDVLDGRGARKNTSQILESTRIPLSESSIAGHVGITGKPLNIEDAYAIDAALPFTFNRAYDVKNKYRTRSMLLVPMCGTDGEVIGVLQLINAREGDRSVPFDSRFESLVTSLASQAAVAVRNAQLTSQLKSAYRDTVLALSIAAEFRDKDTAAHIHRMSHYCKVIADQLGLSEEESEMILLASPMHDVGKLGVPDAILQKPGKLTDDEYAEMKRHTLYGERILAISDAEILRVSREIAASHHERFDGRGYPHGLAGESIPLFGRIAALADVFDALCSRRCYKPPMEVEKAVSIVREERGAHFDPAIVDAFLSGLDEILHYKDLYADERLELGRL